MLKIIAYAMAVLGIGAAPSAGQTVIRGELFDPPAQECLRALEGGVVMSISTDTGRHAADVMIIYSGNLYFMSVGAGTILCRGWRL